MSVEKLYSQFKELTNAATKESVGYRTWKLVEGMYLTWRCSVKKGDL